MKMFNDFSSEEQEYILKMNDGYFYAEMSDSYAITKQEQANWLNGFNEKFGYNFYSFVPNFYGEHEKIGFR